MSDPKSQRFYAWSGPGAPEPESHPLKLYRLVTADFASVGENGVATGTITEMVEAHGVNLLGAHFVFLRGIGPGPATLHRAVAQGLVMDLEEVDTAAVADRLTEDL
jgi:hypothetical protein